MTLRRHHIYCPGSVIENYHRLANLNSEKSKIQITESGGTLTIALSAPFCVDNLDALLYVRISSSHNHHHTGSCVTLESSF